MKYIYYYIKNEMLNEILNSGINIAKIYNTIIQIEDCNCKSLICYLNPKDSTQFYSSDYTILKILITDDLDIYIANDNLNDDLFLNSITVINNYQKGDYEYPLALVLSNVPLKNISIYNKVIDYPIDYNTSEELYYNISLEKILDTYKMNSKTTFWAILEFLCNQGFMEMEEYEDSYVYIDKKTRKKYTISID